MDLILVGIIAYILLQFLVGIYFSRNINNEADYLLAGRRLGPVLAGLSVFATWFGAETCIGAAGSVYEKGLSGATIDPFGYTACLIIMGLVFAVPLWRRNLTTLADLFQQRYSTRIQNLAVILIAPTSVMWAAAQIRAFGQVLSAASGWEVETTIAAASIVVVLYTMYGGLMADVITDSVQGVLLIVGLLVLLYFVLDSAGGAASAMTTIDADRLHIFGANDRSIFEIIEQWAIPICGSVLSQELIARVLAARSPAVARQACIGGGVLYLLVGLVPVMIGLLGWKALPGLEQPEQILPRLAELHLHTFFYIVFAGALISAILSTVDSALLAASSLFSHNLLQPLFKITSEAAKVRLARVVVLICGIAAFILALHADRVYTLVEEASAFGSSGVFVVVIFGLFTRFGGCISAACALLTGVISWIAGQYFLQIDTPYIISLAIALGSYLIAASWETYNNTELRTNSSS